MRRFLIISALFLIASCGRDEIATYVPEVPDHLRQPVVVKCVDGDVAEALGACALKKDAGLREANQRIEAIDKILDLAEIGPQ